MTATMLMSTDAQALRLSLDPFRRGFPSCSPPSGSHFSSDPLDLAHLATGFSFDDEDGDDAEETEA